VFLGEAAYNYRLTDGSSIISYGSDPKDYSTDVLAAKAADFVRGTRDERRHRGARRRGPLTRPPRPA
jgi:hypothetical protein